MRTPAEAAWTGAARSMQPPTARHSEDPGARARANEPCLLHLLVVPIARVRGVRHRVKFCRDMRERARQRQLDLHHHVSFNQAQKRTNTAPYDAWWGLDLRRAVGRLRAEATVTKAVRTDPRPTVQALRLRLAYMPCCCNSAQEQQSQVHHPTLRASRMRGASSVEASFMVYTS
jgi:hypothetical protein